MVKKSYDILPKLGGYATEEGKKIEKKLKACLISKDRLQTEGFFFFFLNKLFPYLLFCKIHSRISVKVPASVNPMGHGFVVKAQ